MYDNYNYPMGADTPDAPWNARDNDEVPFDVCVTQTLTKNDTVMSTNYEEYTTREDGMVDVNYDTSDIDWEDEWMSQAYGIPFLLKELEKYVSKELKSMCEDNRGTKSRRRFLKDILSACQGWTLEETIVEEA